jgi:hypothetical protein
LRRPSGGRVLVLVLAGLGLLAAACNSGPASPGVAGAGLSATSSTDPSSRGSGKSADTALAFSECMRSHGITNFPDPSSGGGISISSGSGIDLSSPQFQVAQNACQHLLSINQGTPAQQAQRRSQMLKFSQCMRAHGISDFPDPTASGMLALRGGPGSDLDPNNPQFEAAQNACSKDLPGGGKGLKKTSGGPPPAGSGNSSTGSGSSGSGGGLATGSGS